MLLIDLLPTDRRPVERTPLPRLLTVIVGVLVAGVELAYIATLLVIEIPGAESKLESEKAQIGRLEDRRKEIAALKADQSEFQRRKMIIVKLYKQRMRWAPKLDAISNPTVLPEKVWLGELDVEEKRAGRGQTEKYLCLQGWSRGDTSRARIEAINMFVRQLESNPQFYSDFEGGLSNDLTIEYVELRGTREAAEGAPAVANRFEMRAKFKRRKPAAAAPPPPGAGR